MADVEVKFGELEAELSETKVVNDKLQCSYNELVEYKLLLDKVLSIDHPKHGCNVATGTYKDILSAGAIDPTKGCEMLLTICFSHS